MIRSLQAIRLTRPQVVAVATLSALATALIIASAMARSSVQSEVLAALQRRVVIHRQPALVSSLGAKRGASPSSPLATSPAGSGGNSGGPSPSALPASSPTPSAVSVPATAPPPATTTSTTTPPAGASSVRRYRVKHIFVIALSTPSYQAAFGRASVARYLSGALTLRGTLLSGYRTLGGSEMPDYLAMVSGQAPNPATRAGCPTYADFPPAAKPAANGQVPGSGCVYPNTVVTVGDQVTAAGGQWKAYLEDMGTATCIHPNSGALDDTALPFSGAQYDTRHNPFIYFHSLLDLGDCASDDVALDQLPGDLRSPSKTPRYAYIAPGLCDDAAAQTCASGKAAGLASEDAFLKLWVPRILSSPAYKHDGALIIAFTSSQAGGAAAARTPVRTGALVISRYATPGRTVARAYDPYSLLRSVDELLGFKPLVNAAKAKSFVAAALPGA
jgi:phosphatidylinositol-3-phosphatase